MKIRQLLLDLERFLIPRAKVSDTAAAMLIRVRSAIDEAERPAPPALEEAIVKSHG